MKQNKANKIRLLTWKYFFKQKWEESKWVLLGILGFIFIPYVLGLITGDFLEILKTATTSGQVVDGFTRVFVTWTNGIVVSMFILILGFFAVIIVLGIARWLQSNWELAEARARRSLK